MVFPHTALVDAPHGAFQVDYSTTFEMDLQQCARITRWGAMMPQGVKMADSQSSDDTGLRLQITARQGE